MSSVCYLSLSLFLLFSLCSFSSLSIVLEIVTKKLLQSYYNSASLFGCFLTHRPISPSSRKSFSSSFCLC